MTVMVVDYGLGNLRSVAGAVERLGFDPVVSGRPDEIARADRLILPGVGAFGDGMRNLRESGLRDALDTAVRGRGTPILGICLGAELMARDGNEFGHHEGLGWIDASVTKLTPSDPSLAIPHVGWNAVHRCGEDSLLADVPDEAWFYFVHSYHIACRDRRAVVAEAEYGGPVLAALHVDNIYGTQFHPEKSQQHGLTVLRNFLGPACSPSGS
jgi:glutamine amidotransferase